MGEIAEMMLDGTLCEQCGAYIGEAVGYPRKCSECEAESCDFSWSINMIKTGILEIQEKGTKNKNKN